MSPHDTESLLRGYVRAFNAADEEYVKQYIPDADAEAWLISQVPRIAVPDRDIERTYYFRWWTYRKHLKKTPEGFVVTEFLPGVPWAGKYNTIPCAVTHHIREGRWLRDNTFLNDYIALWYRDGGRHLHDYSNALEGAIGWLADIRGDDTGLAWLADMEKSYLAWQRERLGKTGLYWSDCDRDGAEYSISGPGLRTTLNSYQYLGARTLSRLYSKQGNNEKAEKYAAEAQTLKKHFNDLLWDDDLGFYTALPQKSPEALPYKDERRRVRELFGYLPWLFGTAEPGRADAFRQLKEEDGFRGVFGPTTAERRHTGFGLFYTGQALQSWLAARGEKPCGAQGHECLWNGPSWPFATSLMLSALANLLTSGEQQDAVTKDDFGDLLHTYAASHQMTKENGQTVPWIDENLNPDTGDWISRTRLMNWNGIRFPQDKGGWERGKDYNHSTFCDVVLEGLFGIRPGENGIRIAPLFPAAWEYARLDGVIARGHKLSVSYARQEGYRVISDGQIVFTSAYPTDFYFPTDKPADPAGTRQI